MSEDLPDPTPVPGEPETFGYRPPRLRITATYDSEGTSRPTSLDVEINDAEALPATLLLLVEGIARVMTQVGTPTSPPAVTGTWTAGTGTAAVYYDKAAA
jgi:hypothetical protein